MDAVASIPSFSTFTTTIEMPYLSERELAKALPFEARKYIPIPLNEVVLDWSIIDILNQAGPGTPVRLPNLPQFKYSSLPYQEMKLKNTEE